MSGGREPGARRRRHEPDPDVGSWASSWVWGVPLIVTTVVVHVLGLVADPGRLRPVLRAGRPPSRVEHLMRFAAATGVAVLLITLLHVMQAIVWAFAYVALGALPSVAQGDALFAQRHDGLWPHRGFPGAPLADARARCRR